ncbi:hypothetical protein EJ04DRAFT_179036 [Polyplosphaeria fusca]|uniref:Uncharacterized protein n=1 Tax=Polyplosphaeria fusca TaxID=682080 RepID=A0A9P4R380_9PLEO|nr:hypothetical protein EJ04DRAFT_179036 [Polyplosphaeria fusca]
MRSAATAQQQRRSNSSLATVNMEPDTGSGTKKRPTPIRIPSPPPPRIKPGRNAFALKEDLEKPDGAVKGFLEKVGLSPRKTDGHAKSTQSRTSKQSQQSQSSTTNEKTSRAEFESRQEDRFFQMMGHVPNPPTPPGEERRHIDVVRVDLTEACQKVAEANKSPKKKIFGMNIPIPSFRASATAGNANAKTTSFNGSGDSSAFPMATPKKAAKVLGASPSGKERNLARIIKSDTSKSLPSKLYDYSHSHSHRQRQYGSTRRNKHSARRTSPSTNKTSVAPIDLSRDERAASPCDDAPPTPPDKDTPPEVKKQKEASTPRLENSENGLSDIGFASQLPQITNLLPPVPIRGGRSPAKFCPPNAEDYAALVENQRIPSAHALFDYASEENTLLGGKRSAPLHGEKRQSVAIREDRWSEENQKRLTKKYGGDPLPPAFYSPSTFSLRLFETEGGHPSRNNNPERLLFNVLPRTHVSAERLDPQRDSVGFALHDNPGKYKQMTTGVSMSSPFRQAGSAEEQKFAPVSATAMQDHANMPSQPRAQPDVIAGGAQFFQPEHSSSRLTDMLGGLSPSRVDSQSEFHPIFPSAVPSPLHQMSQAGQMSPAGVGAETMSSPQPSAGILSDGSNMLHHFYMANEHIDVLGQSLYDKMDGVQHAVMQDVSAKHKETLKVLDQRVDDIKTELASAADRNQVVNAKLDRLLDFIRVEVAEPLKKVTDMSNDIKMLQHMVKELQKTTGLKENVTYGPSSMSLMPQPSFNQPNFNFPDSRSQPSLAQYYSRGNETGQETPSMTPGLQDNRYRFNYGHYRGHGGGRDNHGPGQYGGGHGAGGGYGGYYNQGSHEQGFGYGSGGTK